MLILPIKRVIQDISRRWERKLCLGLRIRIRICLLMDNLSTRINSQANMFLEKSLILRIISTIRSISHSKATQHTKTATPKKSVIRIKRKNPNNTHSQIITNSMVQQLIITVSTRNPTIQQKVTSQSNLYVQQVLMIWTQFTEKISMIKSYRNHAQF